MAITVGSKGLEEVNLEIPQGTSLSFEIEHVDEDTGDPIDHTTDTTCRMAFEEKNGSWFLDLSEYCIPTSSGFYIGIPMDVTKELPLTSSKFKLLWDIIVYTDPYNSVRVCYGDVTVDDTYALDGE